MGAPRRRPGFATVAAYVLLAVLGVALGVVGSFEFSWETLDLPVAAVTLALFDFVVIRAAGRMMEARLGAVVPAVLWMGVVVALSSRRPEGDLVVTGTLAGYVFLLGGVLAALGAIVLTPPAAQPWMARDAPPPRADGAATHQ